MTGDPAPDDADQNARLLAFFEARLDEEQAAAQAAYDAEKPATHQEHSARWRFDGEGVYIDATYSSTPIATGPWGCGISEQVGKHIARHDPTRVLAEIRIKRYLISEYRSVETFDEHAAVEAAMRLPDEQAAMTALGQAWAKEAARSLLLAVIKAEASLYALHPDYEAAWSLWPHVREHGVPQ